MLFEGFQCVGGACGGIPASGWGIRRNKKLIGPNKENKRGNQYFSKSRGLGRFPVFHGFSLC